AEFRSPGTGQTLPNPIPVVKPLDPFGLSADQVEDCHPRITSGDDEHLIGKQCTGCICFCASKTPVFCDPVTNHPVGYNLASTNWGQPVMTDRLRIIDV